MRAGRGLPVAFYDWHAHRPSPRQLADDALGERIGAIYDQSRGTYGWPMVHRALRREGVCVSRKRLDWPPRCIQ